MLFATALQHAEAISTIFFNFVTAIAAVAAALQYFAVTKGLARHTELGLSVRPLFIDGETHTATIELEIVVLNASLRNMTFHNVVSSCEAINPKNRAGRVWGLIDHVSDRDEFVRLHSNTKISFYSTQTVPLDLNLFKVSVLVPYSNRRLTVTTQQQLNQLWGNRDGEEYNQIERYFSASDFYGVAHVAQQTLPADVPASAAAPLQQGRG